MIEIDVYETTAGDKPFEKWFVRVDRHARKRILVAFGKLEDGNTGSLKSVGGGVSEIKIPFGEGYRIYLGREGDRLVICSMAAQKSVRVRILPKPRNCGAIILLKNGIKPKTLNWMVFFV